tara:strand:- start:3104 stop:4138 length:1035 start_codon:yes stop_codon:yes gene_type:complete
MIIINNKIIGKNPFVIAEIGHNHQGSLKKAKDLILAAKYAGADAVKFQKRDNKLLYTKKFYNSPYVSENSYASTYGKHRDFLEFNFKQYKILKEYSKKLKIIFFATPFDFSSVDFLEKLNTPCYKIASGDLTNTVLQKYIAQKQKPVFLSTGGGTLKDIDRAVKNILKYNKKLVVLHCTASYPADVSDMNLNIITQLKKKYKNLIIGLSDHENGIDAASVAYMLGARVFEKHFTINRSWKGTDQSFSLEPIGLKKLVRNLNRIPILLGSSKKYFLKSEKNAVHKMSKSIVAKRFIKKNTKINFNHLDFKSPGGGLKPYEYLKVLNKKIKVDKQIDQEINLKDFK